MIMEADKSQNLQVSQEAGDPGELKVWTPELMV